MKIQKPTLYEEHSQNAIAGLLKKIAWPTYFIGAVLGIFLARGEIVLMFLSWIGAFILGTSYLGFAEIIYLLEDIKNK